MSLAMLTAHLEPAALLLVLGLCLFAILGALRVMATWVEQEQEIHDLKVRSHALRLKVTRRLAQREGLIPYDDAELGEVEVLEPDDPAAEGAVELREMPPTLAAIRGSNPRKSAAASRGARIPTDVAANSGDAQSKAA